MFSNCQGSNFLNILIKDTPAGELFENFHRTSDPKLLRDSIFFHKESSWTFFIIFLWRIKHRNTCRTRGIIAYIDERRHAYTVRCNSSINPAVVVPGPFQAQCPDLNRIVIFQGCLQNIPRSPFECRSYFGLTVKFRIAARQISLG